MVTVEVLRLELLLEVEDVTYEELVDKVLLTVVDNEALEEVEEVELGETVADVLVEAVEDDMDVEDRLVKLELVGRLDEDELTVVEMAEALLSVEEGLTVTDVLEEVLKEEEDFVVVEETMVDELLVTEDVVDIGAEVCYASVSMRTFQWRRSNLRWK